MSHPSKMYFFFILILSLSAATARNSSSVPTPLLIHTWDVSIDPDTTRRINIGPYDDVVDPLRAVRIEAALTDKEEENHDHGRGRGPSVIIRVIHGEELQHFRTVRLGKSARSGSVVLCSEVMRHKIEMLVSSDFSVDVRIKMTSDSFELKVGNNDSDGGGSDEDDDDAPVVVTLSPDDPSTFLVNSSDATHLVLKVETIEDDVGGQEVCMIVAAYRMGCPFKDREDSAVTAEVWFPMRKKGAVTILTEDLGSPFLVTLLVPRTDDVCGGRSDNNNNSNNENNDNNSNSILYTVYKGHGAMTARRSKTVRLSVSEADSYSEYVLPVVLVHVVVAVIVAFGLWLQSLVPKNEERPAAETPSSSQQQPGMLNLELVAAILIPAVHLVVTFLSCSGQCYLNFECAKPFYFFPTFNRLVSSLAGVYFGLACRILVWNSNLIRKELPKKQGLAFIFQGCASILYHFCPNNVTLQIDLAPMYALIMLRMARRFQLMDRTVEIGVSKLTSMLVMTMGLQILPLYYSESHWAVAPLLVFYSYETLSVALFWYNRKDLAGEICSGAIFRRCRIGNTRRLSLAAFFVIANLAFPGYIFVEGWSNQSLLYAMCANAFAFEAYYFVLKGIKLFQFLQRLCIPRGDAVDDQDEDNKPSWWDKTVNFVKDKRVTIIKECLSLASKVLGVLAVTFYFSRTSNRNLSPADSRGLNSECGYLGFFDSHDLWHLLSSVAAFMDFLAMTVAQMKAEKKERDA